jgi:hypothetical protein
MAVAIYGDMLARFGQALSDPTRARIDKPKDTATSSRATIARTLPSTAPIRPARNPQRRSLAV